MKNYLLSIRCALKRWSPPPGSSNVQTDTLSVKRNAGRILWSHLKRLSWYYDQEINIYWGFIYVAMEMNLLTQYIFLASKHWSYDGTKNIFEPIPPGGQHVPNYQFGSQPGRASLAFLEECLRHYCNFSLLYNILSSDAARATRVCPWALWVYFNPIVWIKFFFSTSPSSVPSHKLSQSEDFLGRIFEILVFAPWFRKQVVVFVHFCLLGSPGLDQD